MSSLPSLSSPPLPLLLLPEPNSSSLPCSSQTLNTSSVFAPSLLPLPSPNMGMSCVTMTLGALSNLTALGILAKSYARFRQRAKAPFLLLAGALLTADLGAHVIPGAFSLYLHLSPGSRYGATATAAGEGAEPAAARRVCQLLGASLVFFGLCPLLLGSAMAVERCVGITRPLLHVAVVTADHVRLAVLLLASVAFLLAALPLVDVGSYTPQFPGTWCFLPVRGPRSAGDAGLAAAFSGLGLGALALSLLCNGVSAAALLQARVSGAHHGGGSRQSGGGGGSGGRSYPAVASSSSGLRSLDVEMMAQLAVITVVSCVCWSPFLIFIFISVGQYFRGASLSEPGWEGVALLGLRMASWNQVLDPWVYILLRRAVLRRLCCSAHPERLSHLAESSCSKDPHRPPRISLQ